MENTKILILITQGTVGGAPLSVLSLAREMTRRGYEVTVGFGEGSFVEEECRKDGIPVHRFRHLRRGLNPIRGLRFILEMRKYLKHCRYRVVHINSSNALLAALSTIFFRDRPRVVFSFRGLSLLDSHYELSTLSRLFYTTLFRSLLRRVDASVFVSHENFQSAKNLGMATNSTVILNGLDPDRTVFLSRQESRDQLAELTDFDLHNSFLVGSIGRLVYQKYFDFLIRTWKRVLDKNPRAQCIIIGDGEDRESLERGIERQSLGESVALAGELPHASRYLKGFDLFVLPSRYEGLSIATIEVLFAGTPMLITRTGGNAEVLSNHDPSLFSVGDEDEFVQKISALMNDEGTYREDQKVVEQNATRFHIRTTADGYEEVYFPESTRSIKDGEVAEETTEFIKRYRGAMENLAEK